MKINWVVIGLIVAVIVLLAFALGAKPSHADSGAAPAASTVGYIGHLDVKAPIWNSSSGYIDSSNPVEICGKLNLTNVFGNRCKFTPFVAGDYTLSRRVTAAKSEIQAGFEYPVARDVTFFSYWDRHFQENVDRAFVGIRLNFQGGG